jgi:integrase/recombinase XerD
MASIYRRGKTFWARAQRSNIEHRVSLKTGNRQLAKKRLERWLDELDATAWGETPRLAFDAAVRGFILEHLPTLKPNAAKRYGVSLKWLADRFAGSTLDGIGRGELMEFVDWRRGLGAAAPTIRRDLACLSSVFAFAEDREWIGDGKNPVPGFMRRMAKRGLREAPGRRVYLSGEAEALLLAHCTPQVRAAVIVAIDTGLREQEQLSLTWPQIDFRRGLIQTTADTKSGRVRTVPLSARSAQILAQRKAAGPRGFYVFAHEDGSRVLRHDKGFRAAVRRAIRANAASADPLPFPADLRWHDLRRTAGCRWLQRDRMRMEEVSRLLGHSGLKVTEDRYAFLDEERIATDVGRTKTGTGAGGLH